MRYKGRFSTSEEGKALRACLTAPPALQHRLKEVVVLGGRRPCIGSRCVKKAVCPYGTSEELPPHCLALELHLKRYGKALRKEIDGPIPAALLGIILRREELMALAGWWLSETDPFTKDDAGKLTAQAVVDQYRGLLREQAADLRALGAQRMDRPDPSAVFAKALHQAIDATPSREGDAVAREVAPRCDEDGGGSTNG